MLNLMYITNSPSVAAIAQRYGVDWIFIDLETLGKEERQRDMNTVKSHHTINDISIIKPILTSSKLLVRVNPIHEGSKDEINEVIQRGADIVMLPMWKTVQNVVDFLSFVNGRCKTLILLETKEACEVLDQVLCLKGIDYIHIGLNDLHLSYKMSFMFEPLANGMVDNLCSKIQKSGIPYGFGGIARIGEGIIPAEKLLIEHYRLKSSMAILSRSFCNTDLYTDINTIEEIFSSNMKIIRDYEKKMQDLSPSDITENHEKIVQCVNSIVNSK
ncbi:MAG: aldolase [Bacteroidales bacterium]|nr:aldolase [Bacteroidales bacterium]